MQVHDERKTGLESWFAVFYEVRLHEAEAHRLGAQKETLTEIAARLGVKDEEIMASVASDHQ